MREFTEFEESMMRMWMRERGYSDGYIENIITSLKEISQRFGGIPNPDMVRAAYWNRSKTLRHWRMVAVRVYERYLREEVQGKRR